MQGLVAIVIPHFQRESGILARALRSVFQQRDAPPFRVIVVDDESPAPAVTDVAMMTPSEREAVTIVRRSNGGPSRARNSGLDALPEETQFVALLDADDIWHERHLNQAAAAMQLGYDFFFSDQRREKDEVSWFVHAAFDPAAHLAIDRQRKLYCFQGDMFDVALRKSPIGTSTVVMRRSELGNLRFANDVGTCDDLFFWLEVARSTSNVAFSAEEQVLQGEGINLSVISDWRTNKALRYVVSETRFFKRVREVFPLTSVQLGLVNQRVQRARRIVASTLIGMLRAGHAIELQLVFEILSHDPLALVLLPSVLAQKAFRPFVHPLRTGKGTSIQHAEW